jgi:hypothetical protein
VTLKESETEDLHVRTFRTHAAYLRAWRVLALTDSWAPLDDQLDVLAARAAAALPPVGSLVKVDEAVLASCQRAWGTERILTTTRSYAQDPDVVRLANSWGAVQAYYALYGAVQAVLVSGGGKRPENHESTQKQYVGLWVSRTLDLPPWTYGLGAPGKRPGDAAGFLGTGGMPVDPDSVHPWSNWSNSDAWHIAGGALKGTRQDKCETAANKTRGRKLAQQKKDWKAEEVERQAQGKPARKEKSWPARANLTQAENRAVAQSVRPVSMMDYLYRLRIKANYEDAAMYSDGPDDDAAAGAFLADLEALTSANLLVHEIRLARVVGKRALLSGVDKWLVKNSSTGPGGGLASRRELLAKYV